MLTVAEEAALPAVTVSVAVSFPGLRTVVTTAFFPVGNRAQKNPPPVVRLVLPSFKLEAVE